MILICILGKFETSTRKGKVSVNGNSVYCSIEDFRNYANYKQFFAFKYDSNTTITENITDIKVTTEVNMKNTVGQIYDLSANEKLYTTSSMKTSYNYKKGTKVQVLENVTKNIDKVKVLKTNLIRYRYNNNAIIEKNIINTNTISGRIYTLKNNTKLFDNAMLEKRI